MMRLGAIILAGGRSRRMGQPKESLPFGQTTLLGHTVEILAQCASPTIVVARDANQALPPLDPATKVIFDERIDEGPLRGIDAGLRFAESRCDAVFVTGCDSPFLTASAVQWLAAQLGDCDVLMPCVDNRLQPLAAVYRTSLRALVGELLAKGIRTPRTLAERCRTRILNENDIDSFDSSRQFLRNINDSEEYVEAVADLRGQEPKT